jgi:hypothetical protein
VKKFLKQVDHHDIDKNDLAIRDAVVDGVLGSIPVVGNLYAGAKTYWERIAEINQEAFFEEVSRQTSISKDKLHSNTFARRVLSISIVR